MKRFLALTYLEEAIDINAEEIIYIEEGCLKKESEINNKYVVEKKITTQQEILEAINIVGKVREDLLKVLSQILNKKLEINYDVEVWRIILFYWIEYYPEMMYHKLININQAIEKGVDYTWILDKEDYMIPCYGYGFWYWAYTKERFNYQLYSDVVRFKDIYVNNQISMKQPQINYKKRKDIKEILSKVKLYISNKIARYADTLIMNPDVFGFSLKDRLKLIIKSKGKIGFYYLEKDNVKDMELDYLFRNQNIEEYLIEDIELERLLLNCSLRNLPTMYCEGLKGELIKASKYKCNKIITAEDYTNYRASIIMAECKKRNGKIYDIQIGGDADIYHGTPEAFINAKRVDVLYSGGWKNEEYPCKIKKITNPRFWKAKKAIVQCEKKVDILYVGTATFGQRLLLNNHTSMFPKEYVEDSINFLTYLAKETNLKVRTRFFSTQTGWDMNQRLLQQTNLIEIDDYSRKFIDTVQECKMCIVDAFATPWAEALVMDKPLLFFVPSYLELYSSKGWELVSKLKRAGLYYNTREEIVDYLNKIDDVDIWWESKKEVVDSVRKEYCWCSEDPKKEWMDEFLKISLN